MSEKSRHVKYSTENNLRKLYEREVLNLTRAGRTSEQSTFYNIFDEKIVRNRSIELALGNHFVHDPFNTSIEMFNLTNGLSEALPRLEVPRGSYPDMLGVLPKIQKSRLKDSDLDWIANNWHKKNAEAAGKKGALSTELSKLMIHKSRSQLREEASLRVGNPKQAKSTKTKHPALLEDFSRDPGPTLASNLRQIADELEESKVVEAQSFGAGEVSDAEAKHTHLTANSTTQPAVHPNHKFYRFANSNQFYPVASQRCYELPRKKAANEGFHPYAAKLPKNISIVQRTSSDFYAVERKKVRRQTIDLKQAELLAGLAHSVYPISPMIILEEYYGRGTYYRNKMRDPHFQDRLQLLAQDQETLSVTERENQELLTSDANRDSNNEKSNNSKTPANKERRLLRIGNKTKGVNSFPTVILKDKQDEFSARKVTSIYPYKSYWLKCAVTCLELDSVFDSPDIGYYRVQPFKEQIKLDPEQMSMGEELSDWAGFEQLMQTREAMVEFSVKVELDYTAELERLREYKLAKGR